MTGPWLDIIGVTEAGVAALPVDMQAKIDAAETVILPERFAWAGEGTQNIMTWRSPLSAMLEQVEDCRGSQTVILASGDPNWFGMGATLTRHLTPEEYRVHPAPSSFQLAAARIGWPLQNTETISLHGRPAEALHPHILPRNRILALTSDRQTLTEVAAILVARGYGRSQLTVLEHLGGADEKITGFAASDAVMQSVGDFYVLGIDCVAEAGADLVSPAPGLPDEAFVSDGQLTKREVRAATLGKLAPFPGALLWDVGAGCGSVAIEWMRAARNARAICFERDGERLRMIAENREALGVPGLEIVAGEAPESLDGQPAPDAVFLGGDVGNEALFDACWRALRPGGRLVANAVTIEGEQALYARQQAFGGELARMEVSVLDALGDHRALRPRMAVTQWLAVKGEDA